MYENEQNLFFMAGPPPIPLTGKKVTLFTEINSRYFIGRAKLTHLEWAKSLSVSERIIIYAQLRNGFFLNLPGTIHSCTLYNEK